MPVDERPELPVEGVGVGCGSQGGVGGPVEGDEDVRGRVPVIGGRPAVVDHWGRFQVWVGSCDRDWPTYPGYWSSAGVPNRYAACHVAPWAPSIVRAHAWDRFGDPIRPAVRVAPLPVNTNREESQSLATLSGEAKAAALTGRSPT